jgi:hypothetical protein
LAAVANNFPAMPDMALAGLQYSVDIAGIGGASTTFPPGSLHLISTTFDTSVIDGVVQFDYTIFDQDTHEATMKQMLNGLCNVMAAGMGVTLATVQAAITVTRTWTYAATLAADSLTGCVMTDTMPYP